MKQLFFDKNGNLSQSKFWSNIAFTVATFVVIKLTLDKSNLLGDVFFVYLAVVSGAELGKKLLTMKYDKET